MVLQAVRLEMRSQTFLAADGEPVQQVEIFRWLSERLSLPMPPSLDAASLHPTLLASRKVDPSFTHARLGFSPKFPSYTEGFEHCLQERRL
ncbi:MAG: hypothetical protein HC888_12085 [Candidatus Competibacteraceae bacterium]|nr:hypothetical protein [Candidatus Competibacteraceae bacterium]